MSSCASVKKKQLFLFSMIIVATFFGNVYSKLIYVNPDNPVSPGVSYHTLDSCLLYIEAGQPDSTTIIDTIIFTDTTQHTYTMSTFVQKDIGSLYIIGSATDLNKYPIINHTKKSDHTGSSFYNFIDKNNIYFEKLIFTGDTSFNNGLSAYTVSFKQCVIRNCTDKFFIFSGELSPAINFENCLFTNNTDTLFRLSYWGGTPKLKITNCTFDNCKAIFGPTSESYKDSFSIKNCIFTNIIEPISVASIKSKITNSLFNSNPTGIGEGNKLSIEPNYVVSSARAIPSDWKLQLPSPAIDYVDTSTAPERDLGNQPRGVGGMSDLGCWELQNHPPTAIALSNKTIVENVAANSVVGKLSSTDIDLGETFVYTFDAGGTNNTSFAISNDDLKIKTAPNFEAKGSYFIKIRSTDHGGAFFSDTFTIKITNVNESPYRDSLSNSIVAENAPTGTYIGKFKTFDPDTGDHLFSYQVRSGSDSASFKIGHDSLLTNVIFNFESKSSYSVRIRSMDQGGLYHDSTYVISVTNVNEAPTSLALSDSLVVEHRTDTLVGLLSATDPDAAQTFTYSLVAGTGSTDNGLFKIIGTSLRTAADIAYLTKSVLSIRVQVTDQGGATFQKTFSISVLTLPTITIPPKDTTILSGQAASFSVTATGLNIRYQWTKNNVSIAAETTSTLLLLNKLQADSGTFYKCILTNPTGTVTTDSAHLFVNTPATIAVEPVSDTIAEGDSTVFALTAKGSGVLTYKWFRNGIIVTNADTASIKISAVSKVSDSGSVYQCIVSNVFGSDTSVNAYLHVIKAKPVIRTEPAPVTVDDFKDAMFTLNAWGSTPLKYAWFGTTSADTLSHKDTLILTSVVKAKDSGTSYFCIVSNDVGADTSITVQLHVGTVKPIITIEPDTQSIYEATAARFFIQATGSSPLTFAWYKKGPVSDTLRGTNSDTLLLQNVLRADSGSLYYCIVSNGAGSDTSKQAILNVEKALAKPEITLQLAKTVLRYPGDSLVLVIRATGNPSPLFQWVKNDNAIADKTDTVLVIKNLSLIDSKSRFYCVVSNTQGTVFSDTTTLTVESPPKALFTCSPTVGVLPLDVSFSETSSGAITSRRWDFGDGTLSTVTSPVHKYTVTGQYSIKLVVTGPGGSDSLIQSDLVLAYEEGANPVRVKAQFLKPSKVIITLSNLSNLDVTLPPPMADSLSLWYTKNSLPQLSSTSVRVKTYSTALFKNKTTYSDTITLPATDTIYGIMNSLTYQNGTVSKFVSGNGYMVLMRDTATSTNSITISGNYIKGTTSSIQLTNLTGIDTSQIDSVGIWYGLDSSKVDFSAPPSIWYASTFLRKKNVNQFAFEVQNTMFMDSAKIWCAVICKGVNGKMSVKNFGSFDTRASKLNPITLKATAVSGGQIDLTWNAISDSLFTRICIWKGLSEVPLGASISDNLYDSIRVPVTTNSHSFIGLNANTTYYFGAQALSKDGVWVTITKDSRTSVNTPVSADSIPNTINITKITFDTVSNKISVAWCLDSMKTDSLLVGISSSFDSTPNVNTIQYLNVTQLCDSAAVKVPALLFDTTYHVALWLSKQGSGVWAKPTANSSRTIETPLFTHQAVTFFERNKDTVTAANGKIQLWTDNISSMTPTNDTLRINNFSTPPEGFYVVNSGFEFVKKENNLPFFVGLQYPKLPSPYLASQIRMFRKDFLGNFSVDYLSKIDTVKKIVYVLTDNLIPPFMLLIDTAKPVIIIKDTSIIARVRDGLDTLISDTLVIKDNINNVKWNYSYSRGDGGNAKADSGYFTKLNKNKILTILKNSSAVNVDNGVRINLTVTDGTFTETINCSRRVYRTSSDVSETSPNKWFPLFVTAKINNPSPESMLVKIQTSDSLYDNRYARLYRWYPSKPNSPSKEGYVEYSTATSPLFAFTPGKLMWIKTLKTVIIDFGAGKTLSLKDTLEIELLPLNWTDIGLPYHFNMNLNDILKCTPKSDSLRFCEWVKNSDEIFSTLNLYFPTYAKAEWLNKNIELVYKNGGGLSIFNPSKDTIMLKIPPTPFSLTALSKIASNDKSWSVKISCSTDKGASLPDIYCGYSQGTPEKYYPASPTFIENKIAIFDRTSNSMHGLYQTGNINQGGFAKEIAIVNNSDCVANFSLSAEQSGTFPPDYKTTFYNPISKKFESNGNATIAAHSTEYRWAIASNSAYLERYFSKNLTLSYSLGTLYPNPCRSVLMIPFTIPLSSSDKIRFEIFDQLGRTIWNKDLTLLRAGPQRLVWDGKNKSNMQISAGYYLVRFTSVDKKGKITSRFQKPFTYLP